MTREKAAAIVARMTLAEKADLCSGADVWRVPAIARLGLPSIMLTDGPQGLRKAADRTHSGLERNLPATCFPTASALASSWDVDLLREIGAALGAESAAADVAVLLGPGMNIKRHPLCGRNFEYFSEDPLLSGHLAAAMIDGIQSQGVGACVKHFAANDQEHRRMVVDVIADERTLREIHLRGFEIAVRRSQPWTVMSAYNRINGVYCSENDWLLNDVLRRDWGFEGAVMTDWGAANDRVRGIEAGDDLEMPGSGGVNDRRIIAAVRRGELAESVLDRSVARIVQLVLKSQERPTTYILPGRSRPPRPRPPSCGRGRRPAEERRQCTPAATRCANRSDRRLRQAAPLPGHRQLPRDTHPARPRVRRHAGPHRPRRRASLALRPGLRPGTERTRIPNSSTKPGPSPPTRTPPWYSRDCPRCTNPKASTGPTCGCRNSMTA